MIDSCVTKFSLPYLCGYDVFSFTEASEQDIKILPKARNQERHWVCLEGNSWRLQHTTQNQRLT